MTRTAIALLLLPACAEMSMVNGDLGVTPGGSQDIGFARDEIAGGLIPDQEHFTAEGLFSEHDLPLSGPPCEALLCPRAAATVHRPFVGDPELLVQLGFGTSISSATFQRPDLDIAFLVDTSGSMSGPPLEVSKEAMLAAIDQLGPDDHAALVEFGSTALVRERSRAMDEVGKAKLRDAVRALESNGSTDLESGMRKAYDELDLSLAASHRLMIFTDAQPNTGLTAESDFVTLVRDRAEEEVGLSFFGVSPSLGTELADVIAKVRGGNFFFLDEDSLPVLFGDEFDFVVTPLAYDLEVAVSPAEGVALGAVYGAPVDGGEVRLGASTLFLSSKDGGMAATFAINPEGPLDIGTMAMSYLPVGASGKVKTDVGVRGVGKPDVARVEDTIDVRWEGGTFDGDADDLGVAKIDVLVHQFDAMKIAADACDGTLAMADAAAQVDAAGALLAERAADLSQPDLEIEVALMAKLAENLRAEAPACAAADIYAY